MSALPPEASGSVGPSRRPQITRSASAFTAAASGRVARQRIAQPNGWWGMALFLCAEATLFGTIISSYWYLDFDAHRWPPLGIKPPSTIAPSIATGVLVVLSVLFWLAARSARAGRRGPVISLISFAMVVQIGYLIVQIILFVSDYNKFKPTGSAYGSIYFTMLAADHAHVLFGILLDFTILVFVIVRGLTNYWLIGVRSLALYWHVVNVITVFVLITQLAPAL
jgi:heme/copper-type cytochrome/quinol oxidase subunit 3